MDQIDREEYNLVLDGLVGYLDRLSARLHQLENAVAAQERRLTELDREIERRYNFLAGSISENETFIISTREALGLERVLSEATE